MLLIAREHLFGLTDRIFEPVRDHHIFLGDQHRFDKLSIGSNKLTFGSNRIIFIDFLKILLGSEVFS